MKTLINKIVEHQIISRRDKPQKNSLRIHAISPFDSQCSNQLKTTFKSLKDSRYGSTLNYLIAYYILLCIYAIPFMIEIHVSLTHCNAFGVSSTSHKQSNAKPSSS